MLVVRLKHTASDPKFVPPSKPVPVPNGTILTFSDEHNFTHSDTSSVERGCITTAGFFQVCHDSSCPCCSLPTSLTSTLLLDTIPIKSSTNLCEVLVEVEQKCLCLRPIEKILRPVASIVLLFCEEKKLFFGYVYDPQGYTIPKSIRSHSFKNRRVLQRTNSEAIYHDNTIKHSPQL